MKKRAGKILKGFVIVLIALGLIYAILLGVSSIRLHRAYSALERDNRPMKAEDVIPAALPAAENAALLYESAWLRLKAESAGDTDLLSHMASLAEEFNQGDPNTATREAMERLLQLDVVKNALQSVELGTQRPACRFDASYKGGINMLLPHLRPMRNLARILGAKAHIQMEKGDAQEAWQTITCLLRFADALRQEPTLVSQLVRVAIARMAAQTVYQFPTMTLPDANQMATLNELLVDLEDKAPVVLAFDGERILFGESIFAQSHQTQECLEDEIMGDGPLSSALARAYRLCRPLVLTDHAQYLHIIHEYTRMGEQPYDAQDPSWAKAICEDMPNYLLISYVLTPAGERVYHLHRRMVAQLRIMHVGLVLLRHQQDQGAFPPSLSVLNARIPPDPFTQEPLIYRKEGKGFVLYSLSSDGEDNGGIPKQKNIEKWDIPWHYQGKTAATQ